MRERERLKAIFFPIKNPKNYYKHGPWHTSFAPKGAHQCT